MKAPKYTKLEVIETPKVNMKVFLGEEMKEETKNKIREYAKLLQIKLNYVKQVKKIDSLIDFANSRESEKFVWETLEGEVKPIFDLTDSHLKNIVAYLQEKNRSIPKNIKKEYYQRFGYTEFKEDTFSTLSDYYNSNNEF